MSEILEYTRSNTVNITPKVLKELMKELPILKAEFTQIKAPDYPHLVDQLEFLANAIEDFAEGAYEDLPYAAVAAAVFAILYTHKKVDIIPNFVKNVGYADNSSIVRAVLIDHEKAFSKYAETQGLPWKKITNQP